jgi:hypothetical protein
MKITIEHELTKERLADLFVSFIESGFSNFWCGGVYLKSHGGGSDYENRTNPELPWYSDPLLFDDETLELEILEDEDETGDSETMKKHKVGLAEIKAGIEALAANKDYAHHLNDFVNEKDDADTADILLQFILFKKEVYA